MSFINVRFPPSIAPGVVGGPGFSTDVVAMNSGHESRNENWDAARCSYDAVKGCDTEAKRTELITHFRVARGRAHSFPFKDWTDYLVATGEGLLESVSLGVYQLFKRYTNAGGTDDRTIRLPYDVVVKQGVATLAEGVDYTIDYQSGVLTVLGSPLPAPDSWTGRFDVPCRYDSDRLPLAHESMDVFRSQNIMIIEVRDLDV